MKFGIKTNPQFTSFDDILAVWQRADEIDLFDSAWVFDHFYPISGDLDGPCMEAWTTLTALAQATTRIRVGSMVNGMPYRHPAVTANMAATLDHIAGGRFTLGLGAGWFEPEADAYGIPLGTLTERFDRFDEGVEVIVSLLTRERTTFAGRWYRLADARCEPKPVQGRLPIAIGGRGPRRTLRTVARWADHWDMVRAEDPAAWTRLDAVLVEHCQAVGRDPAEIRRSVHVMWQAGDDPAALAERAAAFAAAGVDLVIFSMRGPYEARLLEPLAAALTA
jgi:F420-dependent oxidoreductase-like protein